jgi:hypothetical protein
MSGSNDSDRQDGRPSVQWERAVTSFTQGGYTVQIDRLPLSRPRFSISIGILRGGTGPSDFTTRIGAYYDHVDGSVQFKTLPPPGLLDSLIEQATRWIEGEVRASEARWQERQQRRERQTSGGAHGRDRRSDK